MVYVKFDQNKTHYAYGAENQMLVVIGGVSAG